LIAATLGFVLVSALLHAAWNALLRRSPDREAASLGIPALSFLLTAAVCPFLPGPAFATGPSLAWGLAAGAFEGLYFLALARALAQAPLGWSYTWMRGGALLLVWPFSLAFLGERLTPVPALSVALVAGGLVLMGGAPERAGRRSLAWAATAGAAIAGYTLCYKLSLDQGSRPLPLFALSMAVSLPIQAGLRLLGGAIRPATFRLRRPGLVLAAGLLSTASFLLYLQALAWAGAGAVTTLRNTSIVFAVIGSALLGERPPARHWAGACLVALGAAGMAWRP